MIWKKWFGQNFAKIHCHAMKCCHGRSPCKITVTRLLPLDYGSIANRVLIDCLFEVVETRLPPLDCWLVVANRLLPVECWSITTRSLPFDCCQSSSDRLLPLVGRFCLRFLDDMCNMLSKCFRGRTPGGLLPLDCWNPILPFDWCNSIVDWLLPLDCCHLIADRLPFEC